VEEFEFSNTLEVLRPARGAFELDQGLKVYEPTMNSALAPLRMAISLRKRCYP
jgi:hypothetical protein